MPIRRGLSALGIALFLLVAQLGAARGADSASEFYEDAVQRFEAGDDDAALIQLRNALQQERNYLPAMVLLSRVYLRQGNGAAAESQINRAVGAGADRASLFNDLLQALLLQGRFADLVEVPIPESLDRRIVAQTRVLRGKAMLELRDFTGAEREFNSAGLLGFAGVEAELGTAMAQLGAGRVTQAAKTAELARRYPDAGAEAWYVSGIIAERQKQLEEAESFLRRAIELEGKHVPARNLLAAILIDTRRSNDALLEIATIQSLAPDDVQAAYLKVLALEHGGDAQAAAAALDEAAELVKDLPKLAIDRHGPSLMVLARSSMAQKQLDLTRGYLNTYLGLYPGHPGATKLLARAALEAQEPAEALRVLEPLRSQGSADPEYMYLTGRAHAMLGHEQEARKAFALVIELAPRDSASMFDVAKAYLEAGDTDKAIGVLTRAWEVQPDDSSVGLMLGFAQLQRGQPAEALRTSQQIQARNAKNPAAFNLMGLAYLALADVESARAAFKRALSLNPRYPPASFNLAQLEQTHGNAKAARDIYLGLLEAEANNARALLELAALERSEGNMDAAIQRLAQAIAVDPDNVRTQLALVKLSVETGQSDLASSRMAELEHRFPNEPAIVLAAAELAVGAGDSARAAALLDRLDRSDQVASEDLERAARLDLRIGRIDHALETLERAVAADPALISAQAALVRLQIRTRAYDAALKRTAILRTALPDQAIGFALEGEVYMAKGDHAGALSRYREAEQRQKSGELAVRIYDARVAAGESPNAALRDLLNFSKADRDNPDILKRLAEIRLEQGNAAEAADLFQRFLEREPDNTAALNNLAWALNELGRAEAVDIARRAVETAPDHPGTLDTLGWVLVRQGQAEEGLRYLREAHARLGQEAEIRYHLGVALQVLGRHAEARAELEAALQGREFRGRDDAEARLAELRAAQASRQ
jgi:putative PEP-CTERM system TPR-repeat lipoprotein